MVLRGRNHHCAWFAGVQNEALRGETDNQEVGDPLASRVSADPPGTDLYLHPITYSPSKRTSLSVTRPHILLCLVRILSCLAPTPSPGPMIVHAQKHMLLCTCSGTFMHSHAQVLAYTHTHVGVLVPARPSHRHSSPTHQTPFAPQESPLTLVFKHAM